MSASRTEARRSEVIDAVFRLVIQGGVQAASLRKVAEESGINIGSVRHYFGSHEALLTAAVHEVVDRTKRRILRHFEQPPPGGEVRTVIETMLAELLPLDDVRKAECIVLYAFTTEARIAPQFTELACQVAAETRAFIRKIMVQAQVAEAEAETDRLAALIDGLTFRAIYLDEVIDADRLRAVVADHLDTVLPRSG